MLALQSVRDGGGRVVVCVPLRWRANVGLGALGQPRHAGSAPMAHTGRYLGVGEAVGCRLCLLSCHA